MLCTAIFVKSSGTLKICDFGMARDNNEHVGGSTQPLTTSHTNRAE
jgi:hypothetical protein